MAADQETRGVSQNSEPSVHLSSETIEKVSDFEHKLYQKALEEERKKMPDTSIHAVSNASELDSVAAYYPKQDVPIFDSSTNKQIDRIDMEIAKLKRAKRTEIIDADANLYMTNLRSRVAADLDKTEEELAAQNEAERLERHKRDSRFIYIVPVFIIAIAIMFAILATVFGV